MKSGSFDIPQDLTKTQDFLVRACLAASRTEQQHWVHKWEEDVQIQDLDYSSSRLVPYFLFRNQQNQVTTRHDNRLKIIYKHWWLRTQHISDQMTKVVAALKSARIRSVIIKGAAIRDYYPRHELRPMADFDLLVRPGTLFKTLEILDQLGFARSTYMANCLAEAPGMTIDFMHGIECAHKIMDVRVDIHWRIGSFCSAGFTEKLWQNLDEAGSCDGLQKARLPYEVFMILMHAAVNRSADNLNWIVDVSVIAACNDRSFWTEARRIAAEEKKTDLFDYACTILSEYGIEVPEISGNISPPGLTLLPQERAKRMTRWSLWRTQIHNLHFQVRNLFPHAGVARLAYQYYRRIRFHFVMRRLSG